MQLLKSKVAFMYREYTVLLKAFAILIIMLGHIANFGGVRWFTPLGGIGVSIFLIVSAYGLTESYTKNGLKGYWKKRLTGVYLPYCFIRVVIIIINSCMGVEYAVWDILLGLLLIKPIHSYDWYMQYLFIWYFIFFMVNTINTSRNKKIIIFSCLSLIMFFIFKRNLYAEQAVSFLFGIYLSYNRDSISKITAKGIILVLIGIAALGMKQYPAFRNADLTYLWNFVQLMNKFCIGAGVVLLFSKIANIVNCKALYKVGLISFELYLLHGYTIEFVKWGNLYGYVLFFVITFASAYLLNAINNFGIKWLDKKMGRLNDRNI